MLILALAAALSAGTAVQAQTQIPAAARPSPELMAAVQAWGACMDAGVTAVPATEAPQAAARRVIASCAPQQQSLTTVTAAWIAATGLPAAQQAQMRARLATVSTGLEPRVVERIQQMRARPTR